MSNKTKNDVNTLGDSDVFETQGTIWVMTSEFLFKTVRQLTWTHVHINASDD